MNCMLKVLLLACALLAASCSTSTSGGLGKSVGSSVRGTYTSQGLAPRAVFEGAVFEVRVAEEGPASPVEVAPVILFAALESELEAGGAKAQKPSEQACDVSMDITLSRYATQKYSNTFRTYVDFKYTVLDVLDARELVARSHSIAGSGGSIEKANDAAMQKVLRKVLENDALTKFLTSRNRTRGDFARAKLDELALKLLVSFEASGARPKEVEGIRVAFAGFKGDDERLFSSTFLSSLQKSWKRPRYRFYTRDQLDKILEEQKLSGSDLMDPSTMAKLGMLKAADFVVTGTCIDSGGSSLIEAQVIQLEDGEVSGSASLSVRRP